MQTLIDSCRQAEVENQDAAKRHYELGTMYQQGEGVAKDLVEAARLLRLAADQGNADAQLSLGGMYYHGEGVARDHREAARCTGSRPTRVMQMRSSSSAGCTPR